MEKVDEEYDNRWTTWHKVNLVQLTPSVIVNWDWCQVNCRKRFDAINGIGKSRQTWIFEDPEDALMFKIARAL